MEPSALIAISPAVKLVLAIAVLVGVHALAIAWATPPSIRRLATSADEELWSTFERAFRRSLERPEQNPIKAALLRGREHATADAEPTRVEEVRP